MIAAGAFFALVAVPGLIGPRGFSNALTLVALVFSLVAAAVAIWVYYVTAERPGEPKGDVTDE